MRERSYSDPTLRVESLIGQNYGVGLRDQGIELAIGERPINNMEAVWGL
jgi:hypothetical protein